MSSKKVNKKIIKNKLWFLSQQLIFTGIPIIVSIVLFYVNNEYKTELSNNKCESSIQNCKSQAPKYCIFVEDNNTYVLEAAEKVFELLGLEKVEFFNKSEVNRDCSLFWTYDYPFHYDFNMENLEYHQRVNHFPGNVGLISKSTLGTTTDSKYIPKAFTSSDDLQKYAEKYPDKRFVQKFYSNRGVELKKASEMNFTESFDDGNFFGQEFIENPLLFEGHKFDFGVYVVITSVNPLRFYYYNDNIFIRLCSRPYDYNNFDDLRTYVINNEHITGSNFEKIEEYYDKSYSYKAAMNDYFTEKGYDMNKVWNQVEDCIRSVVVSRNHFFMDELKYYKSKFSFFELYRFDMILDDALNLYLLEANQSPTIYASTFKYKNRQMYENVVYSTMNLVGIGSPLKRSSFESM